MATSKDLDDLARAFAELIGLVPAVSQTAAPTIAASIAKQFDDGRDAYGNTWASLAVATIQKGRSPPPLTDTGAMKASVKVEARGSDLVASVDDDPARFHQFGTKNMPARPVLPTVDVPSEWAEALDQAGAQVLKTALRNT